MASKGNKLRVNLWNHNPLDGSEIQLLDGRMSRSTKAHLAANEHLRFDKWPVDKRFKYGRMELEACSGSGGGPVNLLSAHHNSEAFAKTGCQNETAYPVWG